MYACIAVLVKIAPMKSTTSQTTRRSATSQKLGDKVGIVERLDRAQSLHVFRLLFHHCVDDVVDRDGANDAAEAVDDRHHDQVVLGRHPRDFLTVRGRLDRDDFRVHDVRDARALRRRQQFAQRHDADELPVGVHHVDRVHRLASS